MVEPMTSTRLLIRMVVTETPVPSTSTSLLNSSLYPPSPAPAATTTMIASGGSSSNLANLGAAGIAIVFILVFIGGILFARKRHMTIRTSRIKPTLPVKDIEAQPDASNSGSTVSVVDIAALASPIPPTKLSSGVDNLPRITITPASSGDSVLLNPRTEMVKRTFITTLPDELKIRAGEVMLVLKDYSDGWALCVNERGEKGTVPLDCFSYGQPHRTDGDDPKLRRGDSLRSTRR